MTKRKRNQPTVEEILERPWCYYCERDFDDLKILISHQRAKHYKCEQCGRRLNTAGGLSVHMSQVHKEQLLTIQNTLPNRTDVSVEIFGMEGIPQDVLEQHKQRITSEYFRNVAERRAQTGNPPPGTVQAGAKKPKIETAEELQKRLAEHKARREAEREGKSDGARLSTTPGNGVGPFATPEASNGSPASMVSTIITLPGFAQIHTNVKQHREEAQTHQASPLVPGFSPPGMPVPGGPVMSPHGQFYPTQAPLAGSPVYGAPAMPPNMPFPPGPAPPFAQHPGFPPVMPSGPPPPFMPFTQPKSTGPFSPGVMNGLPQPPKLPSTTRSPTEIKPQAALDTSVPGLPARPAVNAPSFSREDMARMHAGAPARQNQLGLPPNIPSAINQGPDISSADKTSEAKAISEGVDDLIRSVRDSKAESSESVQADTSAQPSQHPDSIIPNALVDAATVRSESASKEKPSKRSGKKGKNADIKSKLVYSDNAVPPEEKKARSSRYAFSRDEGTAYTLDQPGPTVTGAVRGPDDVLDTQSAH